MSIQSGPGKSRAILIGVCTYDDPAFAPIPAAHNSLVGMHTMLTDPARCGWPPDAISVIEDPAHLGRLARRIRDAARDTEDVLLLYYVGHGQLTPRGELCLTVTDTTATDPDYTGLPFQWIKDALRESPARLKLVILDCCYAGQAIEALSGPDDIADLTHTNGTYTLTATTRNRAAHVTPLDQQGAICTSFTGELLSLTQTGIPDGPPGLTLSDLYPHLRQRLISLGLPQPNQRGTDTADRYIFTKNTYQPGSHPPGQDPAPEVRDADHQTGAAATQADASAIQIARANILYKLGQYQRAEAAYAEIIRLDPTNSRAHIGLGLILFGQEKYADAEAVFVEAILLDPANATGYHHLGEALLAQSQLPQAEVAYREAIRLDSTNAAAYLDLGGILQADKRYTEAETAYREAILLDSADAQAHRGLGDALHSQERLSEAEAAYEEATRLDPTNVDMRDDLDAIQRERALLEERDRERREKEEAEAAFHEAIRRGQSLRGEKRFVEAETAYREAVRLKPDNADAHNYLGNLLYSQERYPESEAEYREAVRLNPANAIFHSNLGGALEDQKRYAEAETSYAEAIRLNPSNVGARQGYALAVRWQERYVEAEAAFREVLRLDPDHRYAYNCLGNTLYLIGKYAEAEDACREAIRRDPTNYDTHNNLGLVLHQLKREAEAEEAYREAIRQKPISVLYSNLGQTLLDLNKNAEAEEAFAEAVRLDPSNTFAYSKLPKKKRRR